MEVDMAGSTIEQARKLFRDIGLAFPYVPEELGAQLTRQSDWVFGTRADAPALYDIDSFVVEACAEPELGYLLFGQDGHGVNSYAMHYYLVRGALALFVQSGWGGAYMDVEESARVIEARFGLARQLADAVDAVAEAGGFEPNERLVVLESDFYGGRWARVRVPVADVAAVAWNRTDEAMKAALAALVE